MQLSQYLQLVDVRARMALRANASRYVLGYVWWILEPLLFVAVFYVVFSVILDSRGSDYLIFLMCGKLVFIWFSKSVNAASNSIVAGYGLVGQLNAPKTLFPMAIIQECLYKQCLVFLLLFAVLKVFGYPVTAVWLWLVPVVFVNYLMIVACGLIGACLVCVVRDFSKLIPLAMTFLLFTSGIFWDVRDIPDPGKMELILTFNPMAFILDAYRQILMYQESPDYSRLLQIGIAFTVLLGLALIFMRRASQYLALKVLTG